MGPSPSQLNQPYLGTEQYRVGEFTLADHCDLAQALSQTKGKWLMTVGNHPAIRALYSDFPQNGVTSQVAIKKVIGGKRDRLRHLLIRNYEPPQTPLYTVAASQLPLMDLFGP